MRDITEQQSSPKDLTSIGNLLTAHFRFSTGEDLLGIASGFISRILLVPHFIKFDTEIKEH